MLLLTVFLERRPHKPALPESSSLRPDPRRKHFCSKCHVLWVGSLRCFAVGCTDHGNSCISFRYNSSLKSLSTLQLMGSYTEMRNYISVLTSVLSRWAKEHASPSCGQWSRTQDAFISSVCRLALHDQVRPRAGRGQWP